MKATAMRLFYSGAHGAMRTAGYEFSSDGLDISDGNYADEVIVAVGRFEAETGKPLSDREDAADSLEEFTAWLKTYTPDALYTLESITLTIPTKRGNGTVSLTAKLHSTNVQAVMNQLYKDIGSLIGNGIQSQEPQQNSQGDSQGNIDNGTETWPVTKFKKYFDEKDGSLRLRVFGGRWLQWGVPLYPEEMKQYQFHEHFQAGEFNPPYAMTADCLMKDGKPKKITKLVKVG